jgi:hypothetical protein
MHPWIAIGALGALASFAWLLTRNLRKRWYGPGTIEIALAMALGVIVAAGALGAWYERTHADYGEPD